MTGHADLMPPNGEERLVLVDEHDLAIGSVEKHAGHREGLLHRAFSIFLFDAKGRVLLQRRAAGKYHSGGLWANTCCGHPRPGEPIEGAAHRRLWEELRLTTDLSFGFSTRYRANLDHGMIENELVHVLSGPLPDGPIDPNPAEADAVHLMSLDELTTEIARHPERYVYWLRAYLRSHEARLRAMAERHASSTGADAPRSAMLDVVRPATSGRC